MSENNKKEEQQLYSKDLFEDEMSMIDDEIRSLDDLFTEVKTHFDAIKNSQARGSLSFVKDQTSNLISIKSAKLNFIKQRADMKKNITDFAFKEKSFASKETSEGLDSLTAEVFKKIANEFKYTPDKHPNDNSNASNQDNEDIDRLLDEELTDVSVDSIVESSTSIEEITVEYNSENQDYTVANGEELLETNLDEKSEEEIDDNTMTVIDLDTYLFYSIDKDTFNIVEELGSVERIIDTTEIGEDTYAIGESGVVYLAITLDDEE